MLAVNNTWKDMGVRDATEAGRLEDPELLSELGQDTSTQAT